MQLSPLQSRLAASLIASVLLLLIYLFLSSPTFALAAELSHMPTIVMEDADGGENLRLRDLRPTYEPEFSAFGRSIIGRAPDGVTGLVNNIPMMEVSLGSGITHFYAFEASTIFGTPAAASADVKRDERTAVLEERQDVAGDVKLRPRQQLKRTIYISATTCVQPRPLKPDTTSMAPPQISLFISTSRNNTKPSPLQDMSTQILKVMNEGLVTYSFNATEDVFFSISAPEVNRGVFMGDYMYQVAVSVDDFYHSFDESPSPLLWVDSDAGGALLMTANLTDSDDPAEIQQIMQRQPPFVVFMANMNFPELNGVRHSMCGLQSYSEMTTMAGGRLNNMVTTAMTTRGPGNLPKQQFYFTGLNSSASYVGYLAYVGKSPMSTTKRQAVGQAGGGGRVFEATQFQTKEGDNCRIITNLEFCNETEYAVPANTDRMNITQLAQFYDNYASTMYGNFKKQLAQVACEAPSTSRYSLTRTCTDCEVAYKKWLCSVTIPRCEDFFTDSGVSLPRNVQQPFPNGTKLPDDVLAQFTQKALQSSRNPLIDDQVAPGPYREILPCEDLCYDLVQSCPASLKFNCPQPGMDIFNVTYAQRGPGLTCNYPGSVHNPSASSVLGVSWLLLSTTLGAALLAQSWL